MATRDETHIVNIPDRFINDETKKIQEQALEQDNRLSDLGEELLALRTKGIYNYINQIQPLDFLLYITIIVSGILLNDYIPWSIRDIMGLLLSIGFVYYLHEGKRATSVDLMKTTEIQMEKIVPKPKYFYYDANFIDFAYNMLSYRLFNKQAYKKMIQAIDSFLQILIDIENHDLQNCAETYEVAVDMKKTALNELQSLIHSIPGDDGMIRSTKLVNAVKTLQLYLQRHLDTMADLCNYRSIKKGWNMYTKRIDKYAIPGVDKTRNPHYNIF